MSKLNLAKLITALLILGSCGQSDHKDHANHDNMSTNEEKNYLSLFDGQSFNGWHAYNKPGQITSWTIEDSALVCLGTAKDAYGGDIVSDKDYGNFDLSWEWKMTTGGNSGVMYHVVEDPKYEAPWETGPEYQVIDDHNFSQPLEDWQKSSADYGMYTANEKKSLKPAGEWNHGRIVFHNGKVEHWLNGEKILDFEAWSQDWNQKKTAGKWKDYPGYGMAKSGKIALQDHGNRVYFRNIRIREL